MEVLIQLPITDLRGLASPESGRHKRPTWPTGSIGVYPGTGEFVCRFGQLRQPHPTMVDGWAGRAQCVSAGRVIRLPASFGQYYTDNLQKYYPAEVLDRCYFGSAVSPRSLAEVRIQIRSWPSVHRWPVIDGIVEATASIPVRVSNSPTIGAIVDVGPKLANFIRINTTSNSFEGRVPAWLVTAGRPIVILLLHKAIKGDPPAYWHRPDPARNLYYRQLDATEVWLVQEPDVRRCRRIALQLARLHNERATYAALARQFARNKSALGLYTLDATRPAVQVAIRDCASYLNRTFTYGEDQSVLYDALSVDLVLHATEWDSLRECFSALPEGLARMAFPALAGLTGERIEVIMGDKFENIHGSNITSRSKVIESFNTIAGNSDPAVEEFLRKVAQEVEILDNQDAADLAEEFIAAVADEKKPSVIRSLWTSLKEVAPVVAGIAGATNVLNILLGG